MKTFNKIIILSIFPLVIGCATQVSDLVTSTNYSSAESDKYESVDKIDTNLDDLIYFEFDNWCIISRIDKNVSSGLETRSSYFINKYLYPIPCKIGPLIANHVNSLKDISDGLIGDLTDMLNDKYGALINVNKIPLSVKTKKILNNKNNLRFFSLFVSSSFERRDVFFKSILNSSSIILNFRILFFLILDLNQHIQF